MDILDKLFSKELTRRTGERVIKIDADKKAGVRKRGKKALKASTKKVKQKILKQEREEKSSFFQRINIRFPWLKIVAVLVLGTIAVLDLLDVTISTVGELSSRVKIAPMSKHVKVTDRVLTGKKLVALTFDDGPSPAVTPKLLDELEKRDVRATFFMLGTMARNNPEIVKRVEKEGHEVASHTMYHQNLPRISKVAADADIKESKAVFKKILGHDINLTRPPYGNYSNATREIINTPIILWSVDTEDWKNHKVDAIMYNVHKQVFDGAIILMHDIYNSSVDAIGRMVDGLRKDGYEFATISEMSEMRGIKLSNKTVYYRF